MNGELRALLDRLEVPGADAPDLWRRTLVLKNYGAVPRPEGTRDSAALGFVLALVDRRGRPRHFVKCRPRRDRGFERECRILRRIGRDPDLAGVVLPARPGESRNIRLHVSEPLEGLRYDRVVPKQELEEWRRTVHHILRISSAVCRRAAELLPGLCDGEPGVRIDEEAEARVACLADSGVARETLDPLLEALDGVRLPREPQHGDLWPGNIFTDADGNPGRLVDFERLGLVRAPLFDAYHMLWSSHRLLFGGGNGRWLALDDGSRAGLWARPARAVVWNVARRLSLDRRQVGAMLVFSVLEMTSHRRRHGAPASYSRSLLRDLRTLAGWMTETGGRELEELVPPPR